MAAGEAPVVITQNEFMRRMKEMAAMSGGGMSQFYGQMPDNFTLVVNGNHPIVIDILQNVEKEYGDKLKSITKKIDAAVQEEKRFEETIDKKKEEELTAEEKNQREELSKKVVTLRDERNERLRQIGEKDSLVRQIIDLALLTNGMLGVHPAIDLADREISGHGTRSIKRGYVLSRHIPFWCVYNRKSTVSLSDAGSSPPPHAAGCNSPKLVQYRPPALNRTGNQT